MDATLARHPVGHVLDGRYRVESHLAQGGMATVYLGTDTRLDRTVALKIMHAELANDEDFVRRFIAEARSVARLSHPNVVTVYDQGADGRVLYLAMEYVPGQTLRDLLRERGRLSPRETLDIMDGVLSGLAAAHSAGLVHRDIKPENVLIGASRKVKVADFGLARMVSGTSHTKTGMLIGTAAYLAPEQVSRGTADTRTDVYAAGVLLFELLTGTQPHTGDTPLAIAYKHVNEVVPPPSSVTPGLPPALDTLVALATSRDPDLRPGDAGQLLHAISGVRSGMPLPARTQEEPPRPGPGTFPARDTPLPQWAERVSAEETLPPVRGAAAGNWQAAPPPSYAPPSSYPPPSGYAPSAGQPVSGPAAHGQGPRDQAPRGEAPYGQAPPGRPAAGPGPSGDRLGPGSDLIPGMGQPPPARQSAGGWQSGPDGDGPTSRLGQDSSYRDITNKTLIVSAPGPYDPPLPAPRYHGSREPRLQRLLFSRRLGYLAIALAVILVFGGLGWWLTAGRYTRVPTVANMTAAAARTYLLNSGLAVTTGQTLVNNQVGKGKVIRTIPAAGAKVPRGGKITLIVSGGPHMIPVPQVTGQPLATAQAALKHAGLTPGTVQQVTSATIAPGIVISTQPTAGTSWPQPKPVDLVVSAGPPLPDFVGHQKSEAEAWAQQAGIQLNEVTAHKSDTPAGTILSERPKPGSPISKGQVVTIVISPGPPMVAIPNVSGMPFGQAIHVLKQLGFKVQVQHIGPFKRVIDYNPKDQAPQGSVITLVVGAP